MRARPLLRTLGTFASFVVLALPATAAGAKPATAALQVGLQKRGLYGGTISGKHNPETTAGLEALARSAGLAAETRLRSRARDLLGRYGNHRLGSRLIRRGSRGWDAAALQFMLAVHGFPSGTFDGIVGPRTATAIRRYQRWARLAVDGVAGPRTIGSLRSPPPRSPVSFRAPVRGWFADRFGPRGNRFHTGLDYPAPGGAAVRAAGAGVVRSTGRDRGGYGKLVVVGHGRGVRTVYAHLARIRVRAGRRVAAGTLLGRVGSTGNATGPHLHFEVRVRGAAVNPLPALR